MRSFGFDGFDVPRGRREGGRESVHRALADDDSERNLGESESLARKYMDELGWIVGDIAAAMSGGGRR